MIKAASAKTKSPRLSDVAKAAGVSQGTASNVFSRPELVRPEVRERVLAAAQSVGYAGPDPRGRMLRAGKVNAIGVATVEPLSVFFEDPYSRELMRGVTEAADAAGAGVSLISTVNPERLAWNIESALVDGFILSCIEGGEKLVELTKARQLPFVAIDLGRPDKTIATIGIDDYGGASSAAQHLLDLGHRRFSVLSLEYNDTELSGWAHPDQVGDAMYHTVRNRLRGYLETLAAAGIDASKVPVWASPSIAVRHRHPDLPLGLEQLFSGPDHPTALLAMSDRLALEALEWLDKRGFRVPEEISVVGFDGVPEGETSQPPLTTMVQPIREIGRQAVTTILSPTAAIDEPRQDILPLTLLVRGSSASPM
ncbi:LacI family DNA-binding transcriptional regulator [Devosia sp.]|uniref:LacI family DNA-binding transcriptional regulator n=1 Tax=Devosia sp. TaxID=1871048 RepID=UPI003A9070AC